MSKIVQRKVAESMHTETNPSHPKEVDILNSYVVVNKAPYTKEIVIARVVTAEGRRRRETLFLPPYSH